MGKNVRKFPIHLSGSGRCSSKGTGIRQAGRLHHDVGGSMMDGSKATTFVDTVT